MIVASPRISNNIITTMKSKTGPNIMRPKYLIYDPCSYRIQTILAILIVREVSINVNTALSKSWGQPFFPFIMIIANRIRHRRNYDLQILQ